MGTTTPWARVGGPIARTVSPREIVGQRYYVVSVVDDVGTSEDNIDRPLIYLLCTMYVLSRHTLARWPIWPRAAWQKHQKRPATGPVTCTAAGRTAGDRSAESDNQTNKA